MPKPRKYDDLTNPNASANEAAIAGALLPLDRVAIEMEGKWGVGVIQRLVSPDTARKFESARQKLDAAIMRADPEEVARRAEVMIKGWRALDAEAGQPPGVDRYWAVKADDDTPYVFVNHEVDTQAAAKAFPNHRVYAMREVVRLLEAEQNKLLDHVKELWPASTVEEVRVRQKVDFDEEIPW